MLFLIGSSLIVVSLVGLLISKSLQFFPSKPNEVLRRRWGDYVDGEDPKPEKGGWKLFWPWIEEGVIIPTGSKTFEIMVDDVITSKDAAKNVVVVNLFTGIDRKNVINFIRTCGDPVRNSNGILEFTFGKLKKKEKESDPEVLDYQGTNFGRALEPVVGMIKSAVRELAAEKKSYPKTWQEAKAAGDNFATAIIQRIMAGEEPTESEAEISGSTPTEVKRAGIIIGKVIIRKVIEEEKLRDATMQKEKEEREKEKSNVEKDLIDEWIADLIAKGVDSQTAAYVAMSRVAEKFDWKVETKDIKGMDKTGGINIMNLGDMLKGGGK